MMNKMSRTPGKELTALNRRVYNFRDCRHSLTKKAYFVNAAVLVHSNRYATYRPSYIDSLIYFYLPSFERVTK
jgi:hypothetical protein